MTTLPIRPEVLALPRYVPGKALRGAQKISSNEMPWPPDQRVVEAAAAALGEANRYPDLTAAPVREELARVLGLSAAQVCVGTGSSAVLVAALSAVCAPGSEVVFPWRSFESYPIAAPTVHASPVPVPLAPDSGPDLGALADAVTPATRAIIVCSPNNPTGVARPASDIAAMVERVPPSVLVIIDEAYIDFATDPAVVPCTELVSAHSNVLVMRTFSKAHALAGLRIGYGLGDAGLIDAVQALLVPFGVNGPAQAAALASLRDGAPAREAVRAVTRERDRIVPLLRRMGYDVPDSQANFYFLKGEGGGFVEACAAAGLVVRPFPEGVRVTVGTPEQNDALLAAAGGRAPAAR